ncbi:uncharacterized protein LOC100196957 isoform X1 [Hydra vulgaris]|uniref:uncharacterized protein LOC100196957 isoform X1 n=2 Tax=Hydra vulgaris TaxID=6087 RepID=UPI001F5EF1FC|nr:uncharacterized protein LOC100196957 [Hydra vulgaris]
MTIRRYKLHLIIPTVVIVLFFLFHVYRLDVWISEKSFYLKQFYHDNTVEFDVKPPSVSNSDSNNRLINKFERNKTNTTRHGKNSPNKTLISAKNKYNNQYRPFENYGKDFSVREKEATSWSKKTEKFKESKIFDKETFETTGTLIKQTNLFNTPTTVVTWQKTSSPVLNKNNNALEMHNIKKPTNNTAYIADLASYFDINLLEPKVKKINNFDTAWSSLSEQCPKTSIGNEANESKSECLLYTEYIDICSSATKYYNKNTFSNENSKCPHKPFSTICSFQNSTRSDVTTNLNLVCNSFLCQKNLFSVGIINLDTGRINYIENLNLTSLHKNIFKNKVMFERHRMEFIFLTCNEKKRKIHQVLKIPPFILTYQNRHEIKVPNLWNINIIVIDSLSRQHFYRTLKKTVAVLNKTNNDLSRDSFVFDYKLFQSLAHFTYVNIQALFSGEKVSNFPKNRRYSFEEFFSKFKNAGYQTLAQEDTCWFDEWGNIFTGNRKFKAKTKLEHENIWSEIKNVSKYYGVDSFGLTHMSCEILRKYKKTNLFNTKKVICLNGKPLSSYFMEHLHERIMATSTTPNSRPLLAYTHINFAHESSGIRIKAIDNDLANLVQKLTKEKHTFSVIFSDHGGKTTKYSINEMAGRFEVYDPFMFIIVPKEVAQKLGSAKMNNLKSNQNSLCNVIDLRNTILRLVNLADESKEDLLMNKMLQRSSCDQFHISEYALCKCINKIDFPDQKENREFVIWLGEFAIGKLNNKLTERKKLAANRCIHLTGSLIRNVIRKEIQFGFVYTFDVVIKFQNKTKERFYFNVYYNNFRNDSMNMLIVKRWDRISVYNTFEKCRDSSIPIQMCLCSNKNIQKITRDYIKEYKQFGKTSQVDYVKKKPCLLLLRREHKKVLSFELLNSCEELVEVSCATSTILFSWQAAEVFPIDLKIAPNSLQYITSFYMLADSEETVNLQINVN